MFTELKQWQEKKKMALLFYLFLIFQVCSKLAFAHSAVKFLPGFEGPLPFELETGYVGVDDSEDVQLFYYFVKSERNPAEDPLLLWLTGGPGCSAFSGLVFEIGPLNFKADVEYNGSLPTLVSNPYSWTKVSNVIFIDSPVGTGFSYATNNLAARTGDFKQVHHLHQFLRKVHPHLLSNSDQVPKKKSLGLFYYLSEAKFSILKWLMDHPDFISSPVYVSGDSYSGIPIPVLAQEISYGNEEGIRPLINLQGYILGNPLTVPNLEANLKIPYAHGMGLISDELFEALKRNCGGDYQNLDPINEECQKDVQYFSNCISGLQIAQILEPICGFASPTPQVIGRRRYLDEHHDQELLDDEPPTLPPIGCRAYSYLLSNYWANDDNVRKALHIRKGSIGEWQRCNYGITYNADVPSSFQYHANLSTRGYRALIYSGDHDLLVPFLATQAWIRSLNYPIVDDWRPWMLQGQVAGYTRKYSNRMTFATVKGGGHTAPEYKPAECLAMFKRWISEEPL
ncbi:serine carboxypeptidase-like 7 isoform X1 [Durio zibethinus]|uniref:Serine carboxypeptidase-like 7 isoform X1 n=1 Tax=Durio zibethinus TaxID=66656 RepID=A0A6P6AUN9_DURZI|nr:serine carboxypeptidase-like 7 isoform X1 [Durio zibethinus]